MKKTENLNNFGNFGCRFGVILGSLGSSKKSLQIHIEWNLIVGLWAENEKGVMIFLIRLPECITRKTKGISCVPNKKNLTTGENIKLWMDIQRVQKNWKPIEPCVPRKLEKCAKVNENLQKLEHFRIFEIRDLFDRFSTVWDLFHRKKVCSSQKPSRQPNHETKKN